MGIAEETELWNEQTVAILARSNILGYQPLHNLPEGEQMLRMRLD